ncbi:MAG: alanine--tRNA ligase [Anaeromassilibacillus sp.]|nr:alanine--tRNA ligase [Anaeromassilibacillus sp.]MDY3778776.1 alanine--tRNA ligase [Candidatus Limousia pullorum]
MQWTGLNELREKFLSFFESKGHLRLPSFSLIPKDDNSLLLINSGMAPMKKYFTGEVTPPRKRVTTCQKCIRTPDIERVGITARHGTYFEMLGNFSFGDYFKHEATAWAWEFFTKVLEMPEELLYVSIYENDDEAFDIWTKEVGVDPSHIVRMGKEDNFWEHGSGPCGPCSEIYFDRGPEKGCGKPDCHVGCECDRFVEVWNLVFTQFNNDGHNNYTPLDHPNIDTGMGLERLACVMQGVDNLFLVDTVQNIMKHISELTGIKYGESEKSDISLRVITDHIRSTTFMIGDGVMPSNEGKGYVLRRLLRRAARHGRLLGMKEPFLYKVCETVIKENESAYPELREKQEFVTKLIKVEEENFLNTVEQGMNMLQGIIDRGDVEVLSGEDSFKLHDTFGFPIDLTREILEEKGISVDIDRFYELLAEQKKRSRDMRKNAGADAWISDSTDLTDVAKTEFVGYSENETQAEILAIVKDGERVEAVGEGESAIFVLNKTPFYGESGGQIGDTGVISGEGFEIEVTNTTKDQGGIFLQAGVVKSGSVAVGMSADAKIDAVRRMDIMRNHTAAHLLQAALREVLGNHVEQAGQLVTDHSVRFDFTHFSAPTAQELMAVEERVNEVILAGMPVEVMEMPIDEAKKMGAMALFGEKYGDVVRVVKAGDFSTELCGGTHVDNTAKIGLFKIRQEGSVAAGVRRIEAVTGHGVLKMVEDAMNMIAQTAITLKISNPREIVAGAERVAGELKEQSRKIQELSDKIAATQIDSLMANSQLEKGVRIICAAMTDVTGDMIKEMCGKILDVAPKAVIVLAGINEGKVTFGCACGKEAREKGANAGKIVKAVAQIAGGNGGGKPDLAMAGAKDPTKVDEAIMQAKAIILDMIKE